MKTYTIKDESLGMSVVSINFTGCLKTSTREYWYLKGKLHREDGPAIDILENAKIWYKNGKLHRESGPAFECFSSKEKHWYKDGELHREDGPAYISYDDTKIWYKNGKCHRTDGPAVEGSNGTKKWYLEGTQYSEEEFNKKIQESTTIKVEYIHQIPYKYTGIVEFPNKSKIWYKDGKIHRVDGPACEYVSGNKEWYKNGLKHREDGPAIEGSNGIKEWYLEGTEYSEQEYNKKIEESKILKVKTFSETPENYTGIIEYSNGNKHWLKNGNLHREDGPAVERSNGHKAWYINGKLHREDGPAQEFIEGYKEWWFQGKQHSEEQHKKKMEESKILKVKTSSEIPKDYTGIAQYYSGDKVWCLEGKLHRVDGPAVEFFNGTKSWYKEGLLHREDGPAIERSSGSKYWYKDGKSHREDGPAIEYTNGDKSWYLEGEYYSEQEFNQKIEESKILKVISYIDIPKDYTGVVQYSNGDKYWLKNGKLHREDGPACIFSNGDKFWYKDGKTHREGAPAIEYPNGTKEWYKEGKLHRIDGPACEYSSGSKYWYKDGKLHREDGPACIFYNGQKEWCLEGREYTEEEFKKKIEESKTIKINNFSEVPENYTGIVQYNNGTKAWFKNGKLHREDGPAIEYADGSKSWYLEDKLHRENGPAVEQSNETKQWYLKNKRHREDGPAVERSNGTKEWYLEGREYTEQEFNQFIQKLKFNSTPVYIAIDTETTGLTPTKSELLSFYAEILDKDFNKISSIELMSKPDNVYYSIDPAAMVVNKINLVEHGKIANNYTTCSEKLSKFLSEQNIDQNNKLIILGQNISFDIMMLTEKYPGFENYWKNFVNRSGLDTGTINLFLKEVGLLDSKCPRSVSDAAKYFNIDASGAHTAKRDVEMTIQLYKKYKNILQSNIIKK